MVDITLVGGFNPSEKYEFVSSDDHSIPNWMESHKFHGSSHHQPVYVWFDSPAIWMNRI